MNQAKSLSVEEQLKRLKKGTQHVKLLRPATVGGGIIQLSASQRKKALATYEANDELRPLKFVPASGAATRMFKRVFDWLANPEVHQGDIDEFFKKVEALAFFEQWLEAANRADIETFESGLASKVRWLETLVDKSGMNLSAKPKGLIPFHSYEKPMTPVYEHLKEALHYTNFNGRVRLHFTVLPEHLSAFQNEVKSLLKLEEFEGVEWDVNFSSQDPSTDTISIDMNDLAEEQAGDAEKRPGGHGALIHNLNALDADLIFIKNIDNVAHQRLLDTTVMHKKALAGVLLQLREDLQGLQQDLDKGLLDENHIMELRERWKIRIPKDYQKLKAYLDRPIRVCGMVKNEGEPGGGPFYTLDPFTGESLQIVEQAQIDQSSSRQQVIAEASTHFNPVDIVCCVKDLQGRKVDLHRYVNNDLYFIAHKHVNGSEIRALEWPGLWNGGMAHWITLFVEVPSETFNPVKEVRDLFRTGHNPS